MRILVTGAAGMLGTAVCAELQNAGYPVVETDKIFRNDLLPLDVRDYDEVQLCIEDHKPGLVLHFAAETDVDKCEAEPDYAFETNAQGTENVARACKHCGCVMAYVSTAGVFDGKKREPYTEGDLPNPINIYGRSKLEGERAVQGILDRYFIFRAGWMVGGWEIDKKFVFKIVQLCRAERQLKVVEDKFGSMTFTVDFARNLMPVIGSAPFGLYHMTNRGSASRFEIAVEIVRLLGLSHVVEVVPVSSEFFPLLAERPRSEMMRNLKLEKLALNNMPDWKISLERYIEENKAKESHIGVYV